MKLYYYALNKQQFGPFTIDELKSKRLKKSTLVWTEGMQDWKPGGEIDEIKDILLSEPPPIPQTSNTSRIIDKVHTKDSITIFSSEKYDLSYQKEIEATIYGVILLVAPVVIQFSNIVIFETEEMYNQVRVGSAIFALLIRIQVAFYVRNIALRQNRNSTSWSWFGFFLPSIAMIIIGLSKKLHLKFTVDGNLPKVEQIAILYQKAVELHSDNRNLESVLIIDKILKIDEFSYKGIRLRGLCNFQLGEYEKAKKDFETLVNNSKYLGESNYYLGRLALFENDYNSATLFWEKAIDNGFMGAKTDLDRFQKFNGRYLLDFGDVISKIGYRLVQGFHDFEVEYMDSENLGLSIPMTKYNSTISAHEFGINIGIPSKKGRLNVAISYHEIIDIVYDDNIGTLRFHLLNNTSVRFKYNYERDSQNSLYKLCNKLDRQSDRHIHAMKTLFENR
jgi:tetratricopeptide (TPR) repeat protein